MEQPSQLSIITIYPATTYSSLQQLRIDAYTVVYILRYMRWRTSLPPSLILPS